MNNHNNAQARGLPALAPAPQAQVAQAPKGAIQAPEEVTQSDANIDVSIDRRGDNGDSTDASSGPAGQGNGASVAANGAQMCSKETVTETVEEKEEEVITETTSPLTKTIVKTTSKTIRTVTIKQVFTNGATNNRSGIGQAGNDAAAPQNDQHEDSGANEMETPGDHGDGVGNSGIVEIPAVPAVPGDGNDVQPAVPLDVEPPFAQDNDNASTQHEQQNQLGIKRRQDDREGAGVGDCVKMPRCQETEHQSGKALEPPSVDSLQDDDKVPASPGSSITGSIDSSF